MPANMGGSAVSCNENQLGEPDERATSQRSRATGALLDAPHMNVAAIDYTYLRLIAQRAVIAHAGYQREGSSAVVLGSPRNTMRRANTAEALPYYLPQSNAQLAGTGAPAPELWQAVRTYNPQIEFVVCINKVPLIPAYIPCRCRNSMPDARRYRRILARYQSVTDDGHNRPSLGDRKPIDGTYA